MKTFIVEYLCPVCAISTYVVQVSYLFWSYSLIFPFIYICMYLRHFFFGRDQCALSEVLICSLKVQVVFLHKEVKPVHSSFSFLGNAYIY